MIWQEKKNLLILLATLLVGNVAFFFTYRVGFEERVRDLDRRKVRAEAQLHEARLQSLRTAEKRRLVDQIQKDVTLVYEDWWATPDERLTALIVEIRRLAETTQLPPRSISYSFVEGKSSGDAEAMLITFSVQGSYAQVRRLINLIELSKQFVTIDSVTIGGAGPDIVNLNLQLRTLFRPSRAEVAEARRPR